MSSQDDDDSSESGDTITTYNLHGYAALPASFGIGIAHVLWPMVWLVLVLGFCLGASGIVSIIEAVKR